MTRNLLFAAALVSAVIWIGSVWWMLEQKATARRFVVEALGLVVLDGFGPEVGAGMFDGRDAERMRLPVALTKVAEGFHQPTDVQFVPGARTLMLVLERAGKCQWIDLDARTRGVLFVTDVTVEGETGLLGLTFHPRFAQNHLFYVHATVMDQGKYQSQVSEWRMSFDAQARPQANRVRDVLHVAQPYNNHKAGQLAFGPDGFLYVGLGDGGSQGDPDHRAQDLTTVLGKMLRIDVDAYAPDRGYSVPADNPFVGREGVPPEIWAYGFRNPWRYSFAPDGRLIVSDVGQDKSEELSIVERGDNLGWSIREGDQCHRARDNGNCDPVEMKAPVYAYDHEDGNAVIGGYVYEAKDNTGLYGRYVFADSIRGRLWAITLPADSSATVATKDAVALGRFPLLVTALGRDRGGRLYVVHFGLTHNSGAIYRIDPQR